MGNRDYYVAMVKLSVVPKMFRFRDWAELPPELRAQRIITKNRIPEITRYIVENEDDYLFSSLTVSYNCDAEFLPLAADHPDIGILEVPFEAEMVINDGQHRRAAIEEAISIKPQLGEQTISVVLFPWEDLDRMQQMFSDLNRTARTTSKSLNILYNHRDLVSQIILVVAEKVDVFRGFVDKERVSLPLRSPKLFTLGALRDATLALLGEVKDADFDEKQSLAIDFWNVVADNIPEWTKVKDGDMKPIELRQEYIHTHAVVLWGIGAAGKAIIAEHPDDWNKKMEGLRSIDWRRTNKEWQGVAMQGTDVVNRRQSRVDTASFIKLKLGLGLSPSEERSLRGATDVSSIMDGLKRFATKS
jgi:DNA sulfur modification protein DndB